MKYRIIKNYYGLKKYCVQRQIGYQWVELTSGCDTAMPLTFWSIHGARKYIKKMKQNGNKPLYIVEEE